MIYPYYLHNNEEFVNYWKNYFKNNLNTLECKYY